MPNTVKKNEFLLPFGRFFTRIDADAYDTIPFQSSDAHGDEFSPSLASPTTWGAEAVEVMAAAACQSVPTNLKAVEENTVPSWLWRHKPMKKVAVTEQESDLRSIFDRAVGSAAATAWKLNLFSSEKQARAFTTKAGTP